MMVLFFTSTFLMNTRAICLQASFATYSMSSKNKFNNKCILLEPLWSFEVLNLWNLNPIQFCHIWYFQFNQPSFKSYIISINILSLQNLNVLFCSDPAPDASIWGEIWRLPLVDYCPLKVWQIKKNPLKVWQIKQGQIGLERSASWSLIPIHGPRGSKGRHSGSQGVKG